MDMYSAVKFRILELCEDKGMTIYRLALESGVSQSTIKSILYGKSKNPGVVTLKMLCDGLGVDIVEFFNTEVFKNLEQEMY